MINIILNRYKDLVRFDNIKADNNLITESDTIKQIIQNYFFIWIAPQLVNSDIFNSNWNIEYAPKSDIQANWYLDTLQPILIDEVQQTISKLPNGKACGPSGVSYKMFKHAGLLFLQLITELLNQCLIC